MSNLRIEFIDNDDGPDLVEVRRVGDMNTVIYKVSEKLGFLEEHFPLELAAYQKTGDKRALDTLIRSNIRLAHKVQRRISDEALTSTTSSPLRSRASSSRQASSTPAKVRRSRPIHASG